MHTESKGKTQKNVTYLEGNVEFLFCDCFSELIAMHGDQTNAHGISQL